VNAKRLILPFLLAALIPAVYWLGGRDSTGAALPPDDPFPTPPPISLNLATIEDLVALPGIGTNIAGRVLEARPADGFQSWEQVGAVSGIGPSRLRLLQETFTLP
jgi:hypothetical protein